MTLIRQAYRTAKKIAEAAGYNLIVTKRPRGEDHYETIVPLASYAPWLADDAFNKTYDAIKNHTLVDKYRCYELWQLVSETAGLQGALIEIGVWKGGTGALITQKAKLMGIGDPVYLCDTFSGVVKAGTNDSTYRGGEHADTSEETARTLLARLNLENARILKGIFPDDTGRRVTESKFRFCHVDVDVYQSARDVVEWLWPKLVVGGIVVFDDYGFKGCDGVTRFVEEERNSIGKLLIYNLNGHAIMVKTESQKGVVACHA